MLKRNNHIADLFDDQEPEPQPRTRRGGPPSILATASAARTAVPAFIEPPLASPKRLAKPDPNRTQKIKAEPALQSDTQADTDVVVQTKLFGFIDRDKIPFLVSFLSHLTLILVFALIPILQIASPHIFINSEAPDTVPEFEITSELAYSDYTYADIGSNSDGLSIDSALSSAPIVSDISASEVLETQPNPNVNVMANIHKAVGATQSSQFVKGATGVGVSGTDGAIDRITHEILKSIEIRPTTVVWLFDASISLTQRRAEIEKRFDRIYLEVGAATKDKISAKSPPPLLTSIVAYGERVNMMQAPTADIKQIQGAIKNIDVDLSGIEMTFAAITMAANEFKDLRKMGKGKEPERNVMIIVITDERGNDIHYLDEAVEACRSYSMPVYVLGVPSPFGREHSIVTFLDPHPRADKEKRLAEIDQGPESFMPERLHLGYVENPEDEPLIDSGFGPYSLSRICYDTGGIFFTIHPSRVYERDITREETSEFVAYLHRFFDPEIMKRYAPDYLSPAEFQRKLKYSPMRSALIDAASVDAIPILDSPPTQFVKHQMINLPQEIDKALSLSSNIKDALESVCKTLDGGKLARDSEQSPRWLAGFDLAYATANAERIRNETYHQMVSKLKGGGMQFQYPENNAWILVPSSEVAGGEEMQKLATEVRDTLVRITEEHKGTPWAYLAEQELQRPIGWSFNEVQMTVTRGPAPLIAPKDSGPRRREPPGPGPKL